MIEIIPLLAFWTHDLSPFVIEFSEPIDWGSFHLDGIRWYGLAYVAGIIAGAFMLRFYYDKKRSPLDPEQQSSLLTMLILGIFLGGRFGYMLLYQFNSLIDDPLSFIRIWEGGMASHGGFVGVMIALLYFAKKTKTSPLLVADIVVTLVPPGLFFGRLANFVNAELWGRVSSVSWAVLFPGSPVNPETAMIDPRHPSQLYEAALEGVILFIYIQLRFWKTKPLPAGQVTGEFLLLYSLLRIVCECFREPDAGLIYGLSRGIFYSIFLAASGLGLILFARKKK